MIKCDQCKRPESKAWDGCDFCAPHPVVERNAFDGDPVLSCGNDWYFWDETWTDIYGPFPDEESCVQALREYERWLVQ